MKFGAASKLQANGGSLHASGALGSWTLPRFRKARSRDAHGPTGLRLEAVTVCNGSNTAILDDVSFDIASAERLAVVGPNGAGKTTLLRLLSGRIGPATGTVRVGGTDLRHLSFAERARRIAVVVQNDVPDLRLTVADYVGLGRIPHAGLAGPQADRRIVDAALERTGLTAFGHRQLDKLSGGERQRSAIARAIAQEPRVLLLDEPTNHLDPRARSDMLDLARTLGITVVAVLHDLSLVHPFADRVAVLDKGRLIALGTPGEALGPDVVRAVFKLDCFPAINPASGRTVLVFDTPDR